MRVVMVGFIRLHGCTYVCITIQIATSIAIATSISSSRLKLRAILLKKTLPTTQSKSAVGLQHHHRGLVRGWHGWDGRRHGTIGGVVTGAIIEVEIRASSVLALKLAIISCSSKRRPSLHHQAAERTG